MRAVPPARCFQGVLPAAIATAARDGTPNVTWLSQVFRVDHAHVALSCQFFNKTKQNVLENPYASVQLWDPVTFEGYRLMLRYDHSETAGPLFDAMSLRIDAIASHTGMAGVFRLISADVYEVLECEKLDAYLVSVDALPPEPLTAQRSELRGLQLVSQCTTRAAGLEELVSSVLETLEQAMGFTHSMLLLLDESGQKLFAIASRGYSEIGVGAEVALGAGLIGTVARERRALRVSGMGGELRYGRAIRASVDHTSARRELQPEIPLPGLPDAQSQLALPLVVSDRLLGVLAVESRDPLGFDEWHEAFLEVVANQVAVALDCAMLRDAGEEGAAAASAGPSASASAGASAPRAARAPQPAEAPAPAGRTRKFRFFRSDDCVFVDDDYLIRNVPGRILWKILCAYSERGRTEFSNRELRLDPALGLPPVRDNLESRLVLLRKRLEQKCPELRLVPTSRGHFRLEASCTVTLEEQDAPA